MARSPFYTRFGESEFTRVEQQTARWSCRRTWVPAAATQASRWEKPFLSRESPSASAFALSPDQELVSFNSSNDTVLGCTPTPQYLNPTTEEPSERCRSVASSDTWAIPLLNC
jgi:hypothetical protein